MADAGACCVVEEPFEAEGPLRAVGWVLEVAHLPLPATLGPVGHPQGPSRGKVHP